MLSLLRNEVAVILETSSSSLSLESSFIELGGNSFSAIALRNSCKTHGIDLSVKSILTAPNILSLVEEAKPLHDLVPFAHQGYEGEREGYLDSNYKQNAPITQMQLALIQGGERYPGSNIIHYCEIHPLHKLPALKSAWKKVVESESIFRTLFKLEEEGGTFMEHDKPDFNWTDIFVDNQTSFQRERDCMQKTSKIETSFKAIILQSPVAGISKCAIVWMVHHALVDGYSCSLLLNNLSRALRGFSIQPSLSFLNLAQSLHQFRNTWRETGEAFWDHQTKTYGMNNGRVPLQTYLPEQRGVANSSLDFTISLNLDDIRIFAQREGVTLATVYYCAWAMVLSKYIGSGVVCMGVVFSGRGLPLEGIMETVGTMVNTLPLHVSLHPGPSSSEYVKSVFKSLVDLSTVQWTVPQDGYTMNFTSALVVQEKPQLFYDNEHLYLEPPTTRVITDIPISICVEHDGRILFSYSKTYNKNDIEQMAKMFLNALSLLIQPHGTVESCLENLISREERKELLILGNCLSATTTLSSVDEDLVDLFHKTALQCPDTVALQRGGNSVTYSQLNHWSDLVASYLEVFIKPGSTVCVHADRSINWIIAIYGVLKIGAVYCPLDSTLPALLRKSYFETARGVLFLTTETNQDDQLIGGDMPRISISEILQDARGSPLARSRERSLKARRDPNAIAYLCFTSGSGGRPKGVMCTHQSLVAFQKDIEVRLWAKPGVKIGQVMSPAFDGSIHEIFSSLSYGATLVLGYSSDPFRHLEAIESVILTPSAAAVLEPEEYPRLQNVYFVGEVVTQRLNDHWAKSKRLYNMYGPTEATCGATIKRLQPGIPVTIGVPNPSTRVYILDGQRRILPRGAIGEIFLAGIQISRGYIGNSKETEERFLPDCILPELNEKMYRTGDQGCWNHLGEIEYVGRTDRQIKLRGFRLDLNDLEKRLLRAVPLAVAVAARTVGDRLLAVFQSDFLHHTTIRKRVSTELPSWAMPQQIVVVPKIPTTTAGKIDYQALDKVELIREELASGPALSPEEKRVAAAWRKALGAPTDFHIDAESNFLELGGTSVQVLLLAHQLTAEFGKHIPLEMLFGMRNLAHLTKDICVLDASPVQVSETLQKALGPHELSPIEYEWWSKYQTTQETSCFNVSFAFKLGKDVDHPKLRNAWNTTLSRHMIFRSRYLRDGSKKAIKEYAKTPPRVQRVSRMRVFEEADRPFQIQKENPIRVLLSSSTLLVTASHIICDLTTAKLVLGEVARSYQGEALDPDSNPYSSTTCWHLDPRRDDLSFWSQYLRNLPVAALSIGRYHLPRSSFRGSSRVFELPASVFEDMVRFTASSKASLHQLLLAAVSVALTYDLDKIDLILGAPHINRNSLQDLNTIGLFLEPLPVRIRYPTYQGDASVGQEASQENVSGLDSLVLEVQRCSQSALSHKVPWQKLMEHLNILPDYPNHPLFDIMVTFHEANSILNPHIPGLSSLRTWTSGSKFKLMVEMQVNDDGSCSMRVEHDTGCFRDSDVEIFKDLLFLALGCLSKGKGCREVKTQLQALAGGDRIYSG
ncbi:BcNRPS1, nonribosomal peptide synthetase [Amylocarpus encephaloides]|uniref:BcNRPS1, nonribosomal peptide synthetase n=1 Tax=Amylocarpus encephaloides TaxID=45428 RepID=A0A9P8C2E2_9HELO|nr:BcNRPS1, nonribosomal peptide synthetase [Amylocarpus encephaloides]